jgi:hypothetical protein
MTSLCCSADLSFAAQQRRTLSCAFRSRPNGRPSSIHSWPDALTARRTHGQVRRSLRHLPARPSDAARSADSPLSQKRVPKQSFCCRPAPAMPQCAHPCRSQARRASLKAATCSGAPPIASSCPWLSFLAASPFLDCRRNARCGGSSSDVCRGVVSGNWHRRAKRRGGGLWLRRRQELKDGTPRFVRFRPQSSPVSFDDRAADR